MGLTQAHDGAITVAFEDIANGFIKHGLFCAIYISGGCCLLFSNSGGF
jgi:hypothetical protein